MNSEKLTRLINSKMIKRTKHEPVGVFCKRFDPKMSVITNLKKQIVEIEGCYQNLANGARFIKTGDNLFDNALCGGIYNGQVCEIISKNYLDEIAQIELSSFLAGIALQQRNGDFIIISDGYFDKEWGEFYPLGFDRFGINSNKILIINTRSKADLQSCSIDIAKTKGLGAFMILSSRKNAFDFSAARKLQIAANMGGAPVFLIPAFGSNTFVPAHLRISVEAIPSDLPYWARGIVTKKITPLGNPAWRVEILKSRIGAVGNFNLEFDYETYNLRGIPLFPDRQIAPIGNSKRFA